MSKTYHAAKTGSDRNTGSLEQPFLTIQAAANVLLPGDTLIVHEGEYREWVNPKNGGLSNTRRITYKAADGERVVIKGSERAQNWQLVEGTVWKAVLPNAMFGDYNPYVETAVGDWLEYKPGIKHLGEVYLNGMSFYEAEGFDELLNQEARTEILDNWTKKMVPVHNPEQTKYLWYAEVNWEVTTVFANFHGADPNAELVEINVRKCCFYPEKTGINYITVKGFEMAHAATPWAPPTGDQPGLIGAHWSKGWIIENNIIHDAKCSAVSIGKEASTGDNNKTKRGDKPGYQYQLESVFAASKIGWSREKIGSHIIRNNVIYDCGQNAIVGHLGCIFSEVYGNHIYNIALKREFWGHEIAGIKFHAPIDAHIHHNHIHDCSLGIWIDWQGQGIRISDNLLHRNNRDLFIEVSHGPHLVDNNILGSEHSLDYFAQGSAFVRNIFAGRIAPVKVLKRSTPYHAPHSTDIAGYALVYGGDDRYFQNVFIGSAGTACFNNHTTSLDEYIAAVRAKEPGDVENFASVEQPVYINENIYLNGAESFDKEQTKYVSSADPAFSLDWQEDGVYLCCNLPGDFEPVSENPPTTAELGRVRIVDAEFENPDGSPVIFDSDSLIHRLKAGSNKILIWK